jgi:hypothetical protein
MSLFALPVTAADLATLEQGIQFFTSPLDNRQALAAAINAGTTTVNAYAHELLASNISLSQVAMAVGSLAFFSTPGVAQLTSWSTQFLPAQVGNAVAHGFEPTVYAAETLGLALAGTPQFSFIYGNHSVGQFAQSIATLTGVNVGPIQGWVENWIAFYTANPEATQGLSVTLAAYGAAYGDAVGVALLNSTSANLQTLVKNALFDNAQGSYVPAIALQGEPTPMPFQGAPNLPANNAGVLEIPTDSVAQGSTMDHISLVGMPQPNQHSDAHWS